MQFTKYKELLIDTLGIMYPNYLKKKLLKQLSEDGIINNNKKTAPKAQVSLLTDVSDIEEINMKFDSIFANDTNNIVYKYIEEFEFIKGYRHSALFEILKVNLDKIEQLIEEKQIVLYKKDNSMYDIVDVEASRPTIRRVGDQLVLKFCFLLNDKTNQGKDIKYVVLAIIDTRDKTLELRLDKVAIEYKISKKDFYASLIDNVLAKLGRLFDIAIKEIDFKAVINYIKAEKDDVNIYAMKMYRNGTFAYLDAFGNEDMVIPILGELKMFIAENELLFNSNKETASIRSNLYDFIDKIEITSDLPSVKMTWPENGIRIGIDHNYKDRQYSFILYFDELGDSKERMDYVRGYLTDSYRQLEAETLTN